MNTIAYIIYLALTFIITVHVGLSLYRNGRIYILSLIENETLTNSVNKILLTGYYLLNLGYSAIILQTWKTIHKWSELIGSVSYMVGRIMITLAIIHYFNMAMIYFIGRSHHNIVNNQT